GMQVDAHLVVASVLDGRGQNNLTLGDAVTGLFQRFGDVAHGDRTIQLTFLAGLADQGDGRTGELAGNGFSRGAGFGVLLFDDVAALLEKLFAFFVGAQRFLFRNKEITGEAVFYFYYVTDTA